MTDLTAVANAYAAAATAFRSLRFAATLAATKRKQGRTNTPDASCFIHLNKAFPNLLRADRLADSCKLDAAVAIVAMCGYATSAAAASVHDAKHLPKEAAYLCVVRAATEAYETCDKAETIFRGAKDDNARTIR